MADVITRLKLESGEYDSKIKRATQGLLQMETECRKVGGTLAILEKEQKQYVQSLGNMQTVSNTVRGKIGELSGAFVELRSQYNRLTDEEKKGDFGKALSASLDQLKIRIHDAKKELNDITTELNGKAGGDGLFGGGKLDGMLQVFGGNLMTKGVELATSAVTSLISETGDMIKQGVELAKQGEGIRIAFERLGRGDIMDGLREATHGTVSDLELMKAAVKFNDFKLPVEELGTMLAFAQQKAKDTGQSIDYMTESIVTGLGRKSLMILDNLGLSATEIRERMKETGDMTKAVGAIIRDQMAAAGDYVETAADRAAQANVSLQNKMEELGRKFAPVEEASNQLWTSMKIGILDIIGGPLATLLNQLTEAGRLKNALNDINGDGSSGNTVVGGKLKQLQAAKNSGASQYVLNSMQSGTIEGWNRQITKADELLKQFEKNHSSVNVVLQNATKQFGQKFSSISELEAFRDAYKVMVSDYRKGASEITKPVKVNIQTDNAIKSVDELKVKLKELQAQRKKVAAGSDEAKRLDTEIRQVKADIKLQDPNAVKTTATKAINDDFTEITGLINMATERVSDLQRRIREAPDETTITTLRDQLKEAQAELDRLNGKEVKIQMETGTSIQNNAGMSAYITSLKKQLETADYGTSLYNGLSAQLADMTTLQNLVSESLKAGLGTAMFDAADATGKDFWTRAMEGGVEDTDWQAIIDKINEKLKELDIKPIQIDFKTGNIANIGKETEKSWRGAASAMSAAGSALQGLEDPGAKIAGIVGQAIANIALGFSQATAASSGGGIFGWIAAIAGGLTTMLSTISAIHSATGYAQGGIVDGRGGGFVGGMAYSGDNVGNVRLDSGELVLNRSQQNNLANALEGGNNNNNNENRQPYVNGELIYLGVNNYLKRTGRGEIVVSKR